MNYSYYFPSNFSWHGYLDAEVCDSLSLEIDRNFLSTGAAVASVSWLYNAYSKENFSKSYFDILNKLTNSEIGQSKYFSKFVDALKVEENLGEIETVLDFIFTYHVRNWWISV